MFLLDSGLIRSLVIHYVIKNYDSDEIFFHDDTSYEILNNNFYKSLNLLFNINEDNQLIIDSYIERCKQPKLDQSLYNSIYHFWRIQHINEEILQNLKLIYDETIDQIPADKNWNRTILSTERLFGRLQIFQTLLFIEIHTKGTQNVRTPYTHFITLLTNLCTTLPDEFVIENDPNRNFACLQFFIGEKSYGQFNSKTMENPPETNIVNYYKRLSENTNAEIYYEMMKRDESCRISILLDIDKFILLFGIPYHIVNLYFGQFFLDCFHPLLDTIIDSGCILSSKPNKSITELLDVNFGCKLSYDKIKKCPNYEKIPINHPKSFTKSLKKLFKISNQVSNPLYDLYYQKTYDIIYAFTVLLEAHPLLIINPFEL
jgi:hypothetical protein